MRNAIGREACLIQRALPHQAEPRFTEGGLQVPHDDQGFWSSISFLKSSLSLVSVSFSQNTIKTKLVHEFWLNFCCAFVVGLVRLLAAPGGFWRLLAIPDGSWPLPATPGDSWRILVTPGGSWRLLTALCGS